MITPEACQIWTQLLGLSVEAKEILTKIQALPPGRC